MNFFVLSTSFVDVLSAIAALIIFFTVILGGPILFSWIFNIKIVSRSGTTLAEPHYAKDIVKNISNFKNDTFKSILNKINRHNSSDYNVITDKVSDKLSKLTKLYELRESGVLTEDEFNILKVEILK